jgi:hypothetical protein
VSVDDWAREHRLAEAVWAARLSDGTEVVSDDGRPGETASAWLRLGEHVRANSLRVVGLALRFRGEPPVRLPDDAAGYFFRRSAGAFLDCPSQSFFLAGWLDGPVVRVRAYSVPDLTFLGEEERDPADPERVGPSLLTN